MYKPIEGGSQYIVKDAHDVDVVCQLPPVGYGVNVITGELEKIGVVKRSSRESEQYWQREKLPAWYEKLRAAEARAQEKDPDYVDEQCERVREQQWQYRLCGYWFLNNGTPTYITGTHWMMLQWWPFQGKYFDFRIPNMEFFYFWQYCTEDPNCLGDIEITKRREGKTARAGIILYEPISRTPAKQGGIQSKTDIDAGKVFKKAVVTPWKKLPHFFRPLYNTMKGDNPDKELRFENPSNKGGRLKVAAHIEQEALESFIDYMPSTIFGYDGQELFIYISDESGKMEKVSIKDRHDVVRFCSETDGVFVGKQHYTTTVEEMDSGGSEFKLLVDQSDRRKLNELGRTTSGLYPYFLPAYRTLFYNKYGFPDEEKAKNYYLAQRQSYIDAGDDRGLASFIRKNPFTLKEAFIHDGEESLFNPTKLQNQYDALYPIKDEIIVKGNFAWKDNVRFSEVVFMRTPNGKFMMPKQFTISSPNSVLRMGPENNRYYIPNNSYKFVIGSDPFKYDKFKDKRRSDCAAFAFQKPDAGDPNHPFSDAFVCRYRYRAATTSAQYEDILMMAWYFGCQILFESNVDNWKSYFRAAGCYGFLMVLPGETEPGIYCDGHGNVHQSIADHTELYIDTSVSKVLFLPTIEEWQLFNLDKTTMFDEAMAAGYTLIAARKKMYRAPVKKGTNTKKKRYFRTYSVP